MATVPVWPKLVKTVWTKNTKGASTLCSLGKPAPPHLTSIFDTTSLMWSSIAFCVCFFVLIAANRSSCRKPIVKGKKISDIGTKYGSSSYSLYGFVLSIPITSWLPLVYIKAANCFLFGIAAVSVVERLFLPACLFFSSKEIWFSYKFSFAWSDASLEKARVFRSWLFL